MAALRRNHVRNKRMGTPIWLLNWCSRPDTDMPSAAASFLRECSRRFLAPPAAQYFASVRRERGFHASTPARWQKNRAGLQSRRVLGCGDGVQKTEQVSFFAECRKNSILRADCIRPFQAGKVVGVGFQEKQGTASVKKTYGMVDLGACHSCAAAVPGFFIGRNFDVAVETHAECRRRLPSRPEFGQAADKQAVCFPDADTVGLIFHTKAVVAQP